MEAGVLVGLEVVVLVVGRFEGRPEVDGDPFLLRADGRVGNWLASSSSYSMSSGAPLSRRNLLEVGTSGGFIRL